MRLRIKEKPAKMTIYIEEDAKIKVQKLAKNEKRSPSQVIENLIVAFGENKKICEQ